MMASRVRSLGPRLPFLRDRDFETESTILLSEYGQEHGAVVEPPIPIDEIVELHLGLCLDFVHMHELFGVDDVHGALWVGQRRVGIDCRLDPAQNRAMLGRYRFTLAHEAGHWRLHRQLFNGVANQLTLLQVSVERPEYICRSFDADPLEYQANRFAASVLMPRNLLRKSWEEWRGNPDPIYLDDLRASEQHSQVPDSPCPGACDSNEDRADNLLLEHAARPLAARFEVSPEAMRIRLEGMGLFLRKREQLLF